MALRSGPVKLFLVPIWLHPEGSECQIEEPGAIRRKRNSYKATSRKISPETSRTSEESSRNF